MKNAKQILEFNKILEQLSECAVSDKAKEKLLGLSMFLDEAICERKMKETSEARRILDSMGTPPISSMQFMESMLERVAVGTMLMPEELGLVASFIKGCNNMKRYLARAEYLECELAYYGRGFNDLNDLKELIELSIRNNQVDSEASTGLKVVRRDIETKKEQIKQRLGKLLQAKKEYLADLYIIERNGHYALAVKKEYKSQVQGSIIDTSRSGGTVFIEPSAVSKLQEELALLEIAEDNEVRKVLYSLTNEVEVYSGEMKLNMDMMESLDIAFAKGKLSAAMKGIGVSVAAGGELTINQGRHPLLEREKCVPLNFYMKEGVRGIVVTGPNTGGKTVALKTVGLLSMMAQCGLHVPVAKGSHFRMFNEILCDIGDGQSIEESLSTFSSHIVSVIEILKRATSESLVLLDELGSGTDPAEGMGIAIATLEALRSQHCLLVATTHYPEVKEYAYQAEGLENARMKFDKESLKPLYELEIGEAGESCAFYIAERLGFPKELIALAGEYTYKQDRKDVGKAANNKLSQQVEKLTNVSNRKPQDSRVSSEVKGQRRSQAAARGRELERGQANNGAKSASFAKEQNIARIKPKKVVKEKSNNKEFQIGDSVVVLPENEKGLVFHKVNDKGKLGVQVKGAKKWVAVKRVKLLVAAQSLYPEDYDFSIIFDTVANRKAKHKMGKGYREDQIATYASEEEAKWQSFE